MHYAKIRRILQEETGRLVFPETPVGELKRLARRILRRRGDMLSPRRKAVLQAFLKNPNACRDTEEVALMSLVPSPLFGICMPFVTGRRVGH